MSYFKISNRIVSSSSVLSGIKIFNFSNFLFSLEDNFQTRAGCSCAGPYGHDLLEIKEFNINNRPGWVRVSIHFSQTKEEIKNLIESIKKIAI